MAEDTPAKHTTASGTALHALLGLSPSSPSLTSFLTSLSSPLPEPEIKPFPDIIYHTYHPLGLSLQFSPVPPFSPSSRSTPADLASAASSNLLRLTGLDIYNHTTAPPPDKHGRVRKSEYGAFPGFPIVLPGGAEVNPGTTGKELVERMGEPKRKGGGTGATPGMGIWTEWSVEVEVEEGKGSREVKVMVEWASSGLQAWEKGGEAGWRVLSVYEE
ncbi:hypothetical protein JCM10213_003473 [Rhodosporidiobolus nylandii]